MGLTFNQESVDLIKKYFKLHHIKLSIFCFFTAAGWKYSLFNLEMLKYDSEKRDEWTLFELVSKED